MSGRARRGQGARIYRAPSSMDRWSQLPLDVRRVVEEHVHAMTLQRASVGTRTAALARPRGRRSDGGSFARARCRARALWRPSCRRTNSAQWLLEPSSWVYMLDAEAHYLEQIVAEVREGR